ncbi:NADPH:quinone oxidoreductase [Minicystis rosea]|nr:NADPH:quinone oxidoreductase [Minicystis rosea]
MSKALLVTGAGGHLGRRVVEILLAQNAGPIIATTRDPEKLADLRARGVDVRRADFDSPESLAAAFAGAGRVLLVSTDSLDRPGRRIEQHRNAVDAAVKAGVDHIVYTSAPKAGPKSPVLVIPDHYATEQALEASSIGYTILRNNLYAELLLGALPRAIATGQHFAAAGEGATAYISREDCARAAAAALASSYTGRRVLEITGTASLTQRELAQIAADLSNKPVTYVPISRAALEAGMQQAGLPAPIAAIYASFDEGISIGELDVVTRAVEELTGTPPEDVRSFLSRHKAALLAPAASSH